MLPLCSPKICSRSSGLITSRPDHATAISQSVPVAVHGAPLLTLRHVDGTYHTKIEMTDGRLSTQAYSP
jgi:hypothetical protein